MARSLRLAGVALVATLAVTAAAGAATVTGTDADDVLAGTAAADSLAGGPGNDRLRGAAGDDLLNGGPGSDDLAGGSGTDAAVYLDHGPVKVTIDDLANDGAADERDNVQVDVEDVYAGPAADELIGSAARNSLEGGGGDDVLDGGAGEDGLYGADGDDRIAARDGRADHVDCGPGDDTAIVDTLDAVRQCELIDRRPVKARVDGTLRWAASVAASTQFTELQLNDVHPATAAATMVCRGGGCPFGRRGLGRRRDVTSALRGAKLRPGTRLELWLTTNGRVGKVVRLTIRRSAAPRRSDLCVNGRRVTASCPQ